VPHIGVYAYLVRFGLRSVLPVREKAETGEDEVLVNDYLAFTRLVALAVNGSSGQKCFG